MYSRARSRPTADLDILHEIVALASSAPGRPAFRTIWRAYDTVLPARGLDPALDTKYFPFILEMESAAGESLCEKFESMLDVGFIGGIG